MAFSKTSLKIKDKTNK